MSQLFPFTNYRAVVFDMDGVLYRGMQVLPGVNELLAFFDQHGIVYACATNNSTLTPQQYEKKLAGMGIAIPAEHIITSSIATRRYLEGEFPRGTPIYMIGMDGLHEALFGDGYFRYEEEQPECVVVGADFEVTYAKLRRACLKIRAGVRFIGTNPDTTFPAEDGIVPGAGSLLALLRAASETEPFVIGKPAPAMMQTAAAILNKPLAQLLTIGDRLDTDIAGANAANVASVLVLTGVTSAEAAEASPIKADIVLAGLPEVLAAWEAQKKSLA